MLGAQKTQALKKLRKLGLLQIEITEASSERLTALREQISSLESAIFTFGKVKKITPIPATTDEALAIATKVAALREEKELCQSQRFTFTAELDRLKKWGELDPTSLLSFKDKGIDISLYELPKADYDALGQDITTLCVAKDKATVRCIVIRSGTEAEAEILAQLNTYRLELPQFSTQDLRNKLSQLDERCKEIDKTIRSYAGYASSMKTAIKAVQKEIEFETYSTGMDSESLSETDADMSVAYFKGYIEADNIDQLKAAAQENAWGILIEDPTEEDNVPTKLKNNKFVSLIYPLTDFLGTVPGYFEYDISGWFLMFILIFFGIIFGDGIYGLLICAIAAYSILKSLITKKPVAPAMLLVGLLGLSTVLWGMLTCTWCGLPAEQLPQWLQSLSIPVISNVNADKIWALPWTPEGVGLTTAQNLQILCFTLALIQLNIAHIKEAARNRKSLKILGDIGSILQLTGMYYVVLSLVVNPQVFPLDLVLGGIPVGTVVITMIGVGFLLSFVFANYAGSIIKSILNSMVNIVSVLLGIFNLFSDIISYIRLWAVGLAGAAIATTVNELAGPMFGNFLFMILAIVLLVFGHGLNMILNILSVIVHGIRLNTLEFSSHLNMSWSGHKFKPFEE